MTARMPVLWMLALVLPTVSCGSSSTVPKSDGTASGRDTGGAARDPDGAGPGADGGPDDSDGDPDDSGGGHGDAGGSGSGPGEDTGASGDEPLECLPSERLDCFHMDIGPAAILEWEDQSELTAGKVLAFPFSHGPATEGEQYGRIAVVGATGASEQGHDLRMWFSAGPGGRPLEGDCARIGIADDVFRWNQNKDVSGYCRLPDEAGRVFFNYALCTATADDFPCLEDSAAFAPEDYRFHMAGTTLSY